MKILMSFILATGLALNAFASESVFSCNELKVAVDWDENTGAPIYQDITANLEVTESEEGAYGYKASYLWEGQTEIELDTKFSFVRDPDMEDIGEILAIMAPEVNPDDVAFAEIAEIGVQAQEEDAAGAILARLYDDMGEELATVGTVGWTAAMCID